MQARDFWKNKKVLVTGAGGFIGSYLSEALVEAGAKVKALVHYNSRNDWGLIELLPVETKGSLEVVTGDIRDPFLMRDIVQGCQIVFHLAALIGIPYSYLATPSYVDTNVRGTLNVLQACLDEEIERVIHTSTSEVYGTAIYTPIDEDHPLQAQSPYSASKIGADKLAESFCLSFELPVVTVRPFNCFGPRQSARAIIPTIITQALAKDSLELGNLDPIRDFTYVEDTVDAFLLAAACDEAVGSVLNVSTNEGHSIGDVAGLVLKLLGRSIPIKQVKERERPPESEVMKLIGSSERFRELTKWSPKHTLEAGLEKTIPWIKEHLGAFKPSIYSI